MLQVCPRLPQTPSHSCAHCAANLNRVDSVESFAPPHPPFPWSFVAIRHHAAVQFDIVGVAQVEGRYKLVGLGNEMVDLTLEYGDAGKDEIPLIRVLDRPGAVQVEQIHTDGRNRLCAGHKKRSRVGHLAPADRDPHSPPNRWNGDYAPDVDNVNAHPGSGIGLRFPGRCNAAGRPPSRGEGIFSSEVPPPSPRPFDTIRRNPTLRRTHGSSSMHRITFPFHHFPRPLSVSKGEGESASQGRQPAGKPVGGPRRNLCSGK